MLWPSEEFDIYFVHLPQYKIIVCKSCRYAVAPQCIRGHLRAFHPQTTARSIRQIQSTTDGLGDAVARSPADVVYPDPDTEPIGALEIYYDALRCTHDDGSGRQCGYVCREPYGMQCHCKVVHNWENPRKRGGNMRIKSTQKIDVLWEACPCCQIFFQNPLWKKYFKVNAELMESSQLRRNSSVEEARALRYENDFLAMQVLSTLDAKEDAYRKSSQKVDDADQHRLNVSPWLEMTRWTRYLDGRDLAAVAPLVYLPEPDEEPLLFQLGESLDRVVEEAYESICQDKINVFDQTRINSFMQRPRAFDRPLMVKLQKASFRQYKGLWKRLICFVCRTMDPEKKIELAHQLTPRQGASLDRLLSKGGNLLCTIQGNNGSSPYDNSANGNDIEQAKKELDRECLIFCIYLLDHTLKGDLFESVIIGFLAVLAIDERKGIFMEAYAFTPALSRFIKISQMLVAQRAVLAVIEGEVDDPCDMLDDMRDRFLIHGSRSPFSWATRLRMYGRKVRNSTTCLGYISWSDDQEVVSYKSLELSMTQFRLFVSDLVHQGQDLLAQLFLLHPDEQREEVVPHLRLIRIKDNAAENCKGWSFLQDSRNKQELPDGRRWLLKRVLDNEWLRDEFVRVKGVNKRAAWNNDAAKDYIRKIDRFLQLLLLLVHITSGQPARGTETLSLRHTNTMHHRNVFIEDGLVSTVTTYHKGYSVTGSTKIIHRYLPREVSELLVYYIWLILPFYQALETLAFDRKVPSTPYLWGDPDMRQDSYKLTSALKMHTSKCFNTALNVTTYRHLSIAMSRTHLKCGGFKRDYGLEESASDQQSAHSSWTAGTIYARGLEEAPGHVQGRRAEYRAVSREWHQFLGFATGLGSRKRPLGEGSDGPNRKGLECI